MATTLNDPQRLRDDLSNLNDAERRVLRLLAEGHTAKSIATTIGCSPAAVNERLREARRKTGVGSSRELARLLKAQESQDDFIGVAKQRAFSPLFTQSSAEPWRPQTGMLAMIALFLVAAAGAATILSQAPASKIEIDPLLGAPMPKFTDPAEWHAKVRAEERDPNWAPGAETQIRERVLQIPLIGKDGNELRVKCGSTLCEIAGTVISPISKRDQEDQNSPPNQAIKNLQVAPLPNDLAKLGLKSEGGTFTGGKGKPDRSVFLIYYSRSQAKPK